MKKQAIILPDIYDPKNWRSALLGAGTGFLGLSGIYALADLLGETGKAIAPVPKLPKKIYVDVKRKKDLEKTGSGTPDASGWSGAMSFGFGLPLGVYGAFKLYDYLAKANRKVNYIRKLRELEDVYEKKYGDVEKKAMLNGYYEGLAAGAKHFLEKNATKEKTFSLLELYPAVLGGLIPLGFITGYHALKHMAPLPEEEREPVPELKFRFNKDKDLVKQSKWYNPVDWIRGIADFLGKREARSTQAQIARYGLGALGSGYLLYRLSDVLKHNLGVRKALGLKPEPWQLKREEDDDEE